jgi:hypothetical protein
MRAERRTSLLIAACLILAAVFLARSLRTGPEPIATVPAPAAVATDSPGRPPALTSSPEPEPALPRFPARVVRRPTETTAKTCELAEPPSTPDAIATATGDPAQAQPIDSRLMEDLERSLARSGNPERLLFAGLAALRPGRAFPVNAADLDRGRALVARAIATDTNDIEVAWHAVRICADEPDGCALQNDWEERLLALDARNSHVWMRVAANRFEAGEHAQALRALRRAASSPETRTFWAESLAMAERSLVLAGDYTFAERADYALAFAASNLPPYPDYVDMCREASAISRDWAYACLEYGAASERSDETLIGQSFARAVQRVALEALDERAQLATVEERDEAARLRLSALGAAGRDWRPRLVSEPGIFFNFLQIAQASGELAAIEYAVGEAGRGHVPVEQADCAQ